MATYWAPFAARHPVALRDSQTNTIRPVGLVLHTAVSDRPLVVPTGTTRWHFYCARDGKLTQFFPVNHMAAAQLDGNEWQADGEWRGFVSVETWDGAGTSVWPNYNSAPDSGPPWNGDQITSLVKLAAWLHTEHDVPLVKATGPRGTGIGYHRQFRNTSPYEWTSTHACPGSKRIAQVPGIITAARELVAPKPQPEPAPTIPPEDVMSGVLPAQLVQVAGSRAVYAVGFTGAVHIKNPTHLRFLREQGWVTEEIQSITAAELAELLEKE